MEEDRRALLRRWLPLRDVAVIAAAAIGMALLLRIFFIDALHISTPSMANTLQVGDYVLVNKFVFGIALPRRIPFLGVELPRWKLPGFSRPRPGDVIVFEHRVRSGGEPLPLVKRCVGVAGDTIEEVRGKILRNGIPMRPVTPGVVPRDINLPGRSWIVSPDSLFVVGDNTDNSLDSRSWGLVAEDDVLGKPMIVYWSRETESRTDAGVLASVRWDRLGRIVR